jgi:hypothetical protein
MELGNPLCGVATQCGLTARTVRSEALFQEDRLTALSLVKAQEGLEQALRLF